jgi:aspartyl-tRNA(Asn)/glutamyl-tRNA(Gln) amidotransferase subunit C
MAITRDDVLHVARLARLALREEEIARLQEQLNAILEAVGKVSELDLADVPPTSHPLELTNVFGSDEPRPSLPLEEALANAPERERDFFRVPAEG